LKDRIEKTPFFKPTAELKDLLTSLVKATPHAKNALALIDPFGNLLIARADRFDISPVHSAIVNVVKDYGEFYLNLLETASKQEASFEDTKAYSYLPDLASCTFIFLNALPGDDLISLQTVGVYGFTMSKHKPAGGPVYINNYDPEALPLEAVIHHLPSLYGR
jgi:hypothetical protein